VSASQSVEHDPWFVSTCHQPNADIRLVCFPFAGGGGSVFSSWKERFDGVDVKSLQLPGRESRFRDKPIDDFELLMCQLVTAIEEKLDKPFVFFGHSLGGLLAFELARHLQERSLPQPEHLIISGKQAIGAQPRRKPIFNLPDDQFITELEKYAGTPKEILESKELIQLLLPMLRADVTLFDCYARRDIKTKLSCPVSVFGADSDPFVAVEDLSGWRAETDGEFNQRIFSGGHFFINDKSEEVINTVRQIINKIPIRG